MFTDQIQHFSFEQDCVPGDAQFDMLRHPRATGDLPLLLFLHGGNGGAGFLERRVAQPLQMAWGLGLLPPCVVVTPECHQSFYLNYASGDQDWERLVVDALPAHLATAHVGIDTTRVLLAGLSMGGSGTLRMAFRYPERFVAAAALEPGIESAFEYHEIPRRDTFWRTVGHEVAHGDPVDTDWWRANNIVSLARANADRIKTSGIKLYMECGTDDCLLLHHSLEFLHRQLWEDGVKHEYRSVLGADHLGPSLPGRIVDALAFLGRSMTPAAIDPELEQLRAMMEQRRVQAGVTV